MHEARILCEVSKTDVERDRSRTNPSRSQEPTPFLYGTSSGRRVFAPYRSLGIIGGEITNDRSDRWPPRRGFPAYEGA